jgi:protein involved in polysaccharide export with SLBB domain
MTMSEAITRAGGLLPSANRRQVVLIRRHEDGRVAGYAVDLRPVANGERPGDDVALQPLDEIVVLRSRIANVNQFVELYIRKNIPVNSLGLGITPF